MNTRLITIDGSRILFTEGRAFFKKNSRPTQADKNEPLVGLHVSKRIVGFYLAVRTSSIRNCILREELTKPINFYYFKTLERYPRQCMVDRACALGK